ncbi:hypothetical protein OUZ56_026337 [Daphnia magna]|uniref:Uncharacterized protein n=1 Tax=Daphnia magna TaxID=35525 RepID=A0ABQ9ZLG5_9CRUS|nr:hypothetical protein OUZ56_026337 [Daphnia magna]
MGQGKIEWTDEVTWLQKRQDKTAKNKTRTPDDDLEGPCLPQPCPMRAAPYVTPKVAAKMRSPSVSVMQMLLFCIRIVWSMIYSNSDLDGRGSSFESWLWVIIELLLPGSKRQVRQRDSNHFVSYWYDVLIWFVKKRYLDMSAGVVETAGVIRLRNPKGLSIGRSGFSCRSVICSEIQLRVWYSLMAYHLPSPVGVAVKLSPVGPTCMLFSPHFLSLTIRQHSRGSTVDMSILSKWLLVFVWLPMCKQLVSLTDA